MSKFYKCELCGNVLEVIEDGGVTPVCCGQKMTEMDGTEYQATVGCKTCSTR